MSHAEHGLKALGLSLMATLGLMAFMTAGAQAQEWRVLGAKLLADETITVSADTEVLLLVPEKLLVIHCSTVTTDEGKLLVAAPVDIDIKLLLSKCKTLYNGVEIPACKPVEPVMFKALLLLMLHNNKNYLLVEEQKAESEEEGTALGLYAASGSCLLFKHVGLTGAVVYECLTAAGAAGDCGEERLSRQIRPFPNQALFGVSLLWGKSAALLDGTLTARLSGSKIDCLWSGVI